MMLAKLVNFDPKHRPYNYVIGYAMDENNSYDQDAIYLMGEPDYTAVELEKDYVDDLVDDYLNGLGMVAISRTNCPICGEDYFNGWRCDCLSPDAQTKFQWRYK